MPPDSYSDLVEPIWDKVNIYDGPEVFLSTFATVDRRAGLLFAAHFCQSEICNGGFYQFFYNDTGVLAPEAVEGFVAIGQSQIGETIQKAMKELGDPYPRDRTVRFASMGDMDFRSFKEENDRFFALLRSENGGFEEAADAYAATVNRDMES